MRGIKSVQYFSDKVVALAVLAICAAGNANAYKFDMGPDSPWEINLDNSVQYSMGWRVQKLDNRIGNHPFFAEGDYKFKNSGDMITNRIQDFVEFQGAYKGLDGHTMGFRTTGSIWKDFAYNDQVKQNPALSPIIGCSYTNCKYSDYTKRYFLEGGEFLDAFVYDNFDIAGTPTYAKVGRLSQYWGNAFYYGFSNIAYSQQPIDFIKGFSQPGSEVKELFLPRKQILVAADLTNEVSVAAQYFLEFQPNRYPEAGTYFGFFDILFNGNQNSGALGGINDGMQKPPDNNHNYGLKLSWSPKWAGVDMGFYYRQLDEVDPWILFSPTGHLQTRFAQKVKLVGFSAEKAFGSYSVGFELNKRIGTALNTALFAPGPNIADKGASGDIINFDLNTFVQLGTNPLWDSGILLVELAGTHLERVTDNAAWYQGVGNAAAGCATAESWRDGCSTKNWTALWFLFDPQWLQVFPGIDFDLPVSYSYGLRGNSPIRASGFYAQQSNIYSIGFKATYQSKNSVELSYQGYNWRTNKTAIGPAGPQYAGFGGAGPVALNDRGWVQLQFKTSF